MRTLEELNLVDDFLVNSLTSHKIYGEQSARYILECILHRQIGKLTVVPQRFFCGENLETHGIRLDVYLDEENGEIFDIEPDQNDGNPPEELKQLLHYMEHSSVENASTENLKKLHRMVTAVKRDGEVGLAYMKSFEREERIRKQGEEEGEIVGKTKEVIRLGRRFGKSEKEIILLLQEELQIDKDKAEDFLKKYDK